LVLSGTEEGQEGTRPANGTKRKGGSMMSLMGRRNHGRSGAWGGGAAVTASPRQGGGGELKGALDAAVGGSAGAGRFDRDDMTSSLEGLMNKQKKKREDAKVHENPAH